MLEKINIDEWKSEETSKDMQNAKEADLICKALVKEIGRAPTWLGVVEAWQSLLRVRRMARELRKEHEQCLGMCANAGYKYAKSPSLSQQG